MVSSAKDRDVTVASPKEASGASKGQSEGGVGDREGAWRRLGGNSYHEQDFRKLFSEGL